ncbi:MAG: PspC domain-containing protein [Chloroflexi bacterium]|nr:PspC domain-containing protein [Chloroflexota bacterium]MBU1661006.1 PspC domain-containing protein [Chloroflexota bacterium]
MKTRVYRSRTDRMLGGVCGGLGDYLGIDPTFIRIFFFIIFFGGSAGFWLYMLLWILVPEEGAAAPGDFGDRVRSLGDDIATAVSRPHPKSGLIIGGGLILLGFFWLIEQLNISWLWWWDFDVLWPVLLIVAGGVLLIRWFGDRSA